VNQETIKAITAEAANLLVDRSLGKVFQLSPFTLVFDFRLRENKYLLISVEPKRPRFYLIERRLRDLEKFSQPPGIFVHALRSQLGNAQLLSITADEKERIVRFEFSSEDELGERHIRSLIAQLTGRSANLFLVDSQDGILHALRPPRGEGQQLGEIYQPPPVQTTKAGLEPAFSIENFPSFSAAADYYYVTLESDEEFQSRVQSHRDRLRRRLSQKEKLKENLAKDLIAHGDAEEHKQIGDLLLANLATAERRGEKVRLQNYYAEGEPTIEIDIDKDLSLQELANRYFTRYSKAKRAKQEISRRLKSLESEVGELNKQLASLETTARERDETALNRLEPQRRQARAATTKKDGTEKISGVRRYRSSDGYEILVGRAAHTNDQLTFKVAKPHDLWLHAADYPGSHVIVRNSSRSEIPQRTIHEAAALAAKFSQAGNDAKVNVNYTQRKFLSKPKRAAPGLVRMSSFRTISVAPGENVERIEGY
jgi:predicted ribosome quality control (RQC) complex YloA/Tae2 family protein